MILFHLKMKSSGEVSFLLFDQKPIKFQSRRLPVIIPQFPDPERVL